jgi:DNA-binding response OmpR family regulator
LVVDDDPEIVPLVKVALSCYAISSDGVHDGASAMERLRVHSYDLVILDLTMAGPTGFDVLQSLKKDTRLRKIPVIVLTGNNSDEALARSFGYGADDFVLKPFKPNELGMRAYRLLYPLTSR